MAPFIFTRKVLAGEPIDVFNQGHHKRDFTYIDDVVEGVVRVMERVPQAANGRLHTPSDDLRIADSGPPAQVPYRLYNIGNHQAVDLQTVVRLLEQCLGRKAQKRFLPMQPGDVLETFADVRDLMRDVGFRPDTPIDQGIRQFVEWYQAYYAARHSRLGAAA
jgi:UDP-glucuronate 4-epimerase